LTRLWQMPPSRIPGSFDARWPESPRAGQGLFPEVQPGKKQLQLREFEDIRHPVSVCALTHEFDGITIYPLVAHRVMEKGAHQISNLSLCSFCPLDAVQPILPLQLVSPARAGHCPNEAEVTPALDILAFCQKNTTF
jgi:hypothetical protein